MRWPQLSLFALAALALSIGFALGWGDALADWAAQWQRQVQNAMAGALRRLRAGEPGALVALLGICFSYGFFHAVGPGHGKVVIGGYALGRQVSLRRISAVAVLSSVAQGMTAVILVGTGALLLQASRQQMTAWAEEDFARISYLAIGAIGLWLVWRGLSSLRRSQSHSTHSASDPCPSCGHHHAPPPEQIAGAKDWRAMGALIGSVAIRPCTGALFLLLLTWNMGLIWQGMLGVLAMSLGTALVTVTAALAAGGLRVSLLSGLGARPWAAQVLPLVEILAGGLVVTAAFAMLGWLG
jgi:ABC-type nickel/cobalt efflux system permease component RcnA